MYRAFVHRALVLLLSVALVTGLTIRVVRADTMDMTVMAMAADMPIHGKCDGCAGGKKATAVMACGFYCSGVVALDSSSVFVVPVLVGFMIATAELTAAGYGFPPDPYSPKPTYMN